MVLVFKFLFALTLNQSLEPEITWHFPVRSCTSCIEKQLEMMTEFYREQDLIVVYYQHEAADKEATTLLTDRLSQWRKSAGFRVRQGDVVGVGWSFFDKLTGEQVTVSFKQGSYNTWRTMEILKLLR